MPDFPVIDVEGTPFECGLQYGQQASERIQRALEIYMRVFKYYTGDEHETVLQKAAAYLPAIEAFDAALADEVRGVAEGANVSVPEILALNARTELMSSAPVRGECTVMGAVYPATRDENRVYLVQNWDWLEPTADLPVILRIKQTGKPVVLALAEAGQLGKVGMNSAGFGICLNWLACNYRRMGVPVHIMTRKLLGCDSAYAIVDALYTSVRGAAANYVIAHRDGFLINYETTPDEVDYFEPQNGTLAHANHFESHRFRPIDTGVKISGDSFPRLQRARQLLHTYHGQIDEATLKQMLRDQHFAPFGICTCPDPDDPEMDRWSTLSSVIYDLSNGHLLITRGNPADEDYVTLSVTQSAAPSPVGD